MNIKRVVHSGASATTSRPDEEGIFAQAGIDFQKRGRCGSVAEVVAAIQDADAAICWSEPYTREVFANAPRLKGVVRTGVGVDTVDLDAATEFGVIVGNFPDFCIAEVANHALVLMMTCAKKVLRLDRAMRNEGWGAAKALTAPMGCLHGETLGLVAFGHIAQAMAKRAKALDMQVLAYDPYAHPKAFEECDVEPVSLEELAQRSDYVSCHVPLNQHTEGMINAAFLSKMKNSAYFINTSRGPVVNEPDLIAALQAGQIAGAGLDVFGQEPIASDNPLLEMDNVVLTPHTASYADQTMILLARRTARACVAIVQGELPEFVANPAVIGNRRNAM